MPGSRRGLTGRVLEEARDNLVEALSLYFEDEDKDVEVDGVSVIVPIDIAV